MEDAIKIISILAATLLALVSIRKYWYEGVLVQIKVKKEQKESGSTDITKVVSEPNERSIKLMKLSSFILIFVAVILENYVFLTFKISKLSIVIHSVCNLFFSVLITATIGLHILEKYFHLERRVASTQKDVFDIYDEVTSVPENLSKRGE